MESSNRSSNKANRFLLYVVMIIGCIVFADLFSLRQIILVAIVVGVLSLREYLKHDE